VSSEDVVAAFLNASRRWSVLRRCRVVTHSHSNFNYAFSAVSLSACVISQSNLYRVIIVDFIFALYISSRSSD